MDHVVRIVEHAACLQNGNAEVRPSAVSHCLLNEEALYRPKHRASSCLHSTEPEWSIRRGRARSSTTPRARSTTFLHIPTDAPR
jgi:hypothetical protein